jgi:hypothetical protein
MLNAEGQKLKQMRDYRKYDVWVKAHQLVFFVYKEIIIEFPKSEQYEWYRK